MRKLISALAAAALVSTGAIAVAQNAADLQIAPPKVSSAGQAQTIPFELFRGNRIYIPATINGRKTTVLLDTGASATTLDTAFARSIGIPEGQKITGQGAGGAVEAEILPGVTLEVGGMRFDDLTAGAMDLSLISRSLGRPVDVILGREFFNSAVVSIDWTASQLTVTPHQAFHPAASATELKLERVGPFNIIPVSIAGGPPVRALLDLGNGGALKLPRSAWSVRKDLADLRYAETRAGGVGGMIPARAALVPSVTLAGQTFTAVPTTLSESGTDERPETMTNVGIGLLKKFKVDLDLGRDRIYLTPRTDAPAFDRDRSGARIEMNANRLKIAFVSPNSPAARAGLKEGDEIVAVDGVPITADYYRNADWARGKVGQAVRLQLANGSTVVVTLQDYY